MIHDETQIYNRYMAFNDIMLEDHDPLEIAAILVIQGLTFYRTFLDEEDYQKIVQNIFDRKNQIKTF